MEELTDHSGDTAEKSADHVSADNIHKKSLSARFIGAKGERAARSYLRRNGYRIVGRNYRASHGEIDIIAFDKKAKRTVFAEVKSRRDEPELIARYGRAAAAVNTRKRTCFISAVLAYQKRYPDSRNCRIDVIEVYFPIKPKLFSKPRIVHLRSAFGMESYHPRSRR